MKVIVNIMTTTRFLYALFLPIVKISFSDKAFFINIIILFLTDWIDGFLARKFNVQTLYGSMMDTIADKALTMILIILLVRKINILAIILIGEIIISIINVLGTFQNKKITSSIRRKSENVVTFYNNNIRIHEYF